MRKKWGALPVLALLSCSVQAATQVELIVKGRVLPPSCTIGLSQATINYGPLPTHKLNAAEPTSITPYMGGTNPPQSLNINCGAPAQIGVQITDNQAGSANVGVIGQALDGAATEIFGLGRDNSGTAIGAYTVSAVDTGATVDGSLGKIITSTDGTNWSATSNAPFSNTSGWTLSWTAASSAAAPEPVTTVAQALNIAAAVVGYASLDLASPLALDGSMTIELVYL